MADEVLSLRVQLESAKTQKDLETLRRQTTEFRKAQLLGSKEFQQAARLEVDVKNKLHGLNVQAYSDNAKMKESYFQLGKDLRQHRFAALQLADAMGANKTALGGVMMAMAGPGGWIAGVTAGLAAMISTVVNTRNNIRDLKKELRSLQADTPQEQLAELLLQRSELKRPSNIGRYGTLRSLLGMAEEETQVYLVALEKLDKMITEVKKKLAPDIGYALPAPGVTDRFEYAAGESGRRGFGGLRLTSFRPPTFRPGEAVGESEYHDERIASGYYDDPRRRRKDYTNQYAYNDEIGQFMRDKFPPGKKLGTELEKISPLAQNIGNSINLYIGGALDNVIGKAGGLASLFSSIFGTVIQFAVSTGLTALSGGGGAGAGIGVGGGGFGPALTAGGARPRIKTIGTIRGGGGSGGGGGQGRTVVKGQDLVIVYDRAKKVKMNRGF